MPRRHSRTILCLVLLIPFALAAQAADAALHLPIDLAALASWVLKGLAALVGGTVLWLLKVGVQAFNSFKDEMSARLDTLDTAIGLVQRDVHTTKQELFGVSGANGIRGELREIKSDARRTKDIAEAHEVLLARLADKAGVPFEGHS